MKTEQILNERKKTHGDFEEVARVYSHLKEALAGSSKRVHMSDSKSAHHILSLEMICLKMARIVCGDPDFDDHWDDIAGYAMLGKGRGSGTEKFSGALIIDDPREIEKGRYAKGWNDGNDSVLAIYFGLKEENKQLKEKNKQLELDVVMAHNKGVDAASEYYESILDYLKNRWFNVEKCLPITGKKLTISYKGKIMKNVRMYIHSDYQPHFIHCEDGIETPLCKDMIAGWIYSDESIQDSLIESITKNSRLKDVEELKAKCSTSSKMEHVVPDVKFWCNGCEQQKTGKPQDVGILKDGTPMLNCEDCCEKLTRAVKGIFKKEHEGDKEWYDGTKCLPLTGKKVIAHIKSKNNAYDLNHTAMLMTFGKEALITLVNCDMDIGPFEVLKWKYAD